MDEIQMVPAGSRSLVRNRDFVLFVCARLTNIFGIQILEVAVGWHLYQMTSNPLDLGLVGLSQFAPVLLLFLVAGVAADHFDRRGIIVVCNLVHGTAAVILLFIAMSDQKQTWPIFAVMVVNGAARGFFQPASQAILPNIVSKELFPNALAYATSINRIGQLGGPALGGILIAVTGNWVYVGAASMFAAAAVAAGLIAVRLVIRQVSGLNSILDGFRFIWRRKIVLGAMSMDLLAVFFGGIVGIMPVFARDVLHVGPEGFGLMRAMPAMGSLTVALVLAQLVAPRHMGRLLFMALTAFGAAIVVFSLSSVLWLSLLALTVYGAADMISVYVRQTLVQLATPDAMRGRVSAVNSVSITASNELGDFRAGTMGAAIGTIPAILIGGLVTLGVAAAWSRLFPELRRVDRLDQVE
jgi:MFS family permease